MTWLQHVKFKPEWNKKLHFEVNQNIPVLPALNEIRITLVLRLLLIFSTATARSCGSMLPSTGGYLTMGEEPILLELTSNKLDSLLK
jgi:hypothetical protein